MLKLRLVVSYVSVHSLSSILNICAVSVQTVTQSVQSLVAGMKQVNEEIQQSRRMPPNPQDRFVIVMQVKHRVSAFGHHIHASLAFRIADELRNRVASEHVEFAGQRAPCFASVLWRKPRLS